MQLRDIAAEEARQMEQVLEGAAGPSGVAPPAEHVPLQRNPTWFEKKHKHHHVGMSHKIEHAKHVAHVKLEKAEHALEHAAHSAEHAIEHAAHAASHAAHEHAERRSSARQRPSRSSFSGKATNRPDLDLEDSEEDAFAEEPEPPAAPSSPLEEPLLPGQMKRMPSGKSVYKL